MGNAVRISEYGRKRQENPDDNYSVMQHRLEASSLRWSNHTDQFTKNKIVNTNMNFIYRFDFIFIYYGLDCIYAHNDIEIRYL